MLREEDISTFINLVCKGEDPCRRTRMYQFFPKRITTVAKERFNQQLLEIKQNNIAINEKGQKRGKNEHPLHRFRKKWVKNDYETSKPENSIRLVTTSLLNPKLYHQSSKKMTFYEQYKEKIKKKHQQKQEQDLKFCSCERKTPNLSLSYRTRWLGNSNCTFHDPGPMISETISRPIKNSLKNKSNHRVAPQIIQRRLLSFSEESPKKVHPVISKEIRMQRKNKQLAYLRLKTQGPSRSFAKESTGHTTLSKQIMSHTLQGWGNSELDEYQPVYV